MGLAKSGSDPESFLIRQMGITKLRKPWNSHFEITTIHLYNCSQCTVVLSLVAGYKRRCAYTDPVIPVRVLHLFHNN